ncbi:MAG TPA: dihydrofolate reductase [Gammaproteobacteria bacterium]|nr:dihydrofolate reductase [Gammaproteobacteria bacterium]
MRVTFLVAAADNGVIGSDNRLPWHLPADMRYFARTTKGGTLLMGRKTYESLGPTAERPNPLPGRRLIVVSRHPEGLPADDEVVAAGSVREGIGWAEEHGCDELFVVGGAQVFEAAWPLADRLRLTRVHAEPAGDTHFPDPDPDQWQVVEADRHPADDDNPHACTFWVLDRR